MATLCETFPIVLADSDGIVKGNVPFLRAEYKYNTK